MEINAGPAPLMLEAPTIQVGQVVWGRKKATMRSIRLLLARLWSDECGISSVEYALLLAFIAAGIIMGAEMLSNAVSNEMKDTAALFGDELFGGDGCGNSGGGDGTGGDDGTGQGGGNTC